MVLFLSVLLFSSQLWATVNFSGIESATTIIESRERFEQRAKRVLNHWSESTIPEFSQRNGNGFALGALGRFYTGQDLPEFNLHILDPKTIPYAKYGTDISLFKGLCKRNGDYDFMLHQLIRLVYSAPEGKLWPETKEKIINTLLTAKGDNHYTHFWLGPCGRHKDTENHILMTEGSRYLTNQLLMDLGSNSPRYDNDQNGFHHWMLTHLQEFFKNHFDEYNSRPYQIYTIMALNNIHSYARDSRVALASEMLLDYSSALWAVQSNQGRRSVPFRRQPRYEPLKELYPGDAEMARFALLAGNFPYILEPPFEGNSLYGNHAMMAALVGKYRVPDMLLDLIVNVKSKTYYQRIHHQGVEIYSSAPEYLISAGGVFKNRFDGNTGENDGWARPTTLIPTYENSADWSKWFRFEGHKNKKKRRNTCVIGNFACGLGFSPAPEIPSSCQEQVGAWTFYDFDSPKCPLKWKIRLATMILPNKKLIKHAKNFGLWEVRSSQEISYVDFKKKILDNNKKNKFKLGRTNIYKTSKNEIIEFQFSPTGIKKWEIISYKGKKEERHFSKWPLAQGDVIDAKNDGKITIKHPAWKRRLVLDMTNPDAPQRTEE